jgi:hypothetical protein
MYGPGGDQRIKHSLASHLRTWKLKLPCGVWVSTESDGASERGKADRPGRASRSSP